jgi:hypothetical protein
MLSGRLPVDTRSPSLYTRAHGRSRMAVCTQKEVAMSVQHAVGWRWGRRRILGGLTLAGTAGVLGLCPGLPPPSRPRRQSKCV